MADKPLVEDFQKLDPGSELVHLYELEYEKGEFVYFHSGVEEDLSTLHFRDYDSPATVREYVALPIKSEGFEVKNDGAIARPNVLIANINTVFSNAIGTLDYNDILGLKFIRRTTLKKYLDNGSGNSSNPPVEYPRQVWIMDRIKTRSKSYVQIELLSPFDLETAKIPARVIFADRCSFKYQGASPHLDRWKREQSGCNWHIEGTLYGGTVGNGVKFTVFVNEDDEYVVPSTTSFTTVGSTSFSATKDSYYRNTKTSTRFNANGSTSSVTISNYWQARSSGVLGTPSDSNSNYKRVRVYSTYNHGTEYFTYVDDRDNDYVVFTDNVSTSETYNKTLLWKADQPSENQAPGYTKYWKKGDLCSKTTTGCKMRFGFSPKSVNSSASTGKAATNTNAVLPFGGFPAARNFK